VAARANQIAQPVRQRPGSAAMLAIERSGLSSMSLRAFSAVATNATSFPSRRGFLILSSPFCRNDETKLVAPPDPNGRNSHQQFVFEKRGHTCKRKVAPHDVFSRGI